MPTNLKTTVPNCLVRGRISKLPIRTIPKDSQIIRRQSARGVPLALAAFGFCLINLQGSAQVTTRTNGGKDSAAKIGSQPTNPKTEPVDGFFDHPQLGAEVWAVPGTTAAQYDNWMKTLAQFHMRARLYMSPEKHMYPSMSLDGPDWKAHLEEFLQPFDLAFAAANRHDVKIMLTLPTFWAPQDAEGWSRQGEAIRLIVRRYKNNQALYLWGISSEPHIKFTGNPNVGAGTSDPTDVSKIPFSLVAPGYHAWLATKYGDIKSLNVKWRTEFAGFEDVPPNSGVADNGYVTQQASYNDWHEYWRYYLTDFMVRISILVRQDDPNHPLTVNPDNIMSNLSAQSQDIPAWRPAVSIMGASLHPAWHFSRLHRRDQYALGVAFTCDELRGLSAPKPFMVTEMQGGPVIYSGGIQISPNESDIAQWTWTAIGSGARQLYYWLLNTRPEGVEAGEWALLDYQDKPTSRLIAAGSVEKVLDDKADFFRHSQPTASPVTIILSMDAMTFQLSQASQPQSPNTAALMDEALGIYQAFLSLGVPVNIRSIDDFPWAETADQRQVIILPHLSALTREQAAHITTFETNGNMVIATGLTGLWSPMYELQTLNDFPLEKALGGDFKSATLEDVDNFIPITVNQSRIILPAKQIIGEIDNRTGKVLSEEGGRILAAETHLGKGSAYWIPSLVGTAAFQGDQKPLAELINVLTANITKDVVFKFTSYQPDVVLRTLQNRKSYLTVITNGSNSPVKCQLAFPAGLKSTVLWGEMGSIDNRGEVSLGARQTLVLMWQ